MDHLISLSKKWRTLIDGSRTDTGGGSVIYRKRTKEERCCIALRKYATVFLTEVLGILEYQQLCLAIGFANDLITVRTDIQAAIKATS